MNYTELHQLLKEKVNYIDDIIALDSKTSLYNFNFESGHCNILPNGDEQENESGRQTEEKILNIEDSSIIENQKFRYHVFHPTNIERTKQVILMFHGLNEKYWTKYLPWAKRLSELTGKSIVLFPIAFHMNRAPHAWSERQLMQPLSEERRRHFPQILHSTISNVAISSRLHHCPQRLFWSGLQTYYDVIKLLEEFKSGKNPLIEPDADYDIFSFSIGCLLAEILMMTNHKGYFNKSKLCMFCGGAIFNRLSPVSKFILDSEANVALYSYVVEHLESHLKIDPKLSHYLNDLPEGINFKTMINYKTNISLREILFKKLADRMTAITLTNDTVVPPYEVINTLQGSLRDVPVQVKIVDFPYKYRHEDPFPSNIRNIKEKVNEEFEKIFQIAAEFLQN